LISLEVLVLKTIMKNINAKGLIFLSIIAIPAIASAGFADFFGIGAVAKSISDATWKIYAVKTAATVMPIIFLITAIAGTMVAACAIVKVGDAFVDTARNVLKDDKVGNTEKAILIVQTLYTLLAVVMFAAMGVMLALVVYNGCKDIFTYTPPAIEEKVALKK